MTSNILAIRREIAAQWLAKNGLPNKKMEDWKYIDLRELSTLSFHDPKPHSENWSQFQPIIAKARVGKRPYITLIDGHYIKALSQAPDLLIRLLSEITNSEAQWLDQKIASEMTDGVRAAHAALIGAGIWIQAPARQKTTIQVIHLTSSGTQAAPTIVVQTQNQAQMTLIETYFSGVNAQPNWTNTQVILDLLPSSHLLHIKIVSEDSEKGFHTAHTNVNIASNSLYNALTLTLSGKLRREDLRIQLAGSGAEAHFAAVYTANKKCSVDHHTIVKHLVPHTSSDQLYKGIIDENASGGFNGKVFVEKDAQKSSAKQLNQNILLSQSAQINTKPELQIFADDVQCGHGATIGQLDPEQLFYLESRAIPPNKARQILLFGFASDTLSRINNKALQSDLNALLMNHLQGVQK